MSVIDDINDNISDLNDQLADAENTISDHDSRLSTVEDSTQNIDPERVNQLNFPLDQDTQDLISSFIKSNVILSGIATLAYNGSNSSYTITNQNISPTSIAAGMYINNSGSGINSLSYANLGGGQIKFFSAGNQPYNFSYIIIL